MYRSSADRRASGVAEILPAPIDSRFCGDIDEFDKPERRIDREPHRLLQTQLEATLLRQIDG